MTTLYYKELLEYSYDICVKTYECPPISRLDYLGEYIFDFTTYDSDMSVLFVTKAVEVCTAINSQSTYDYIKDKNNYTWYLLMCNMPFFSSRLDWGLSIRGAWWTNQIGQLFELKSTGLYENGEQLMIIKFDVESWKQFINAVIEFATTEVTK